MNNDDCGQDYEAQKQTEQGANEQAQNDAGEQECHGITINEGGVWVKGIERALREGGSTHTVEDVLRQIEAGKAQLWVRDNALIVTEIHETPRASILHFWLATGKMEPVLELHREVMEWGRTQGCDRATLTGRRGWLRVLAGLGWRETLALMEAKL